MVLLLWFWLIALYHLRMIFPVDGRSPRPRDDRIDPEWSMAIERMDLDYEELGTKPPTLATSEYSPRDNWDLAGHLEIPYYALLYMNVTKQIGQPGETRSIQTHSTEPGSACGGILVDQSRVLTTCGCLYTWSKYLYYKDLEPKEREAFEKKKAIFKYSMNKRWFSAKDSAAHARGEYAPTIYVSHSQVYFWPDFSHKLINDRKKQTAKRLQCNLYRKSVGMRGLGSIHGLIIANFEPAIQDMDLSSFIPWPPVPLSKILPSQNKPKPAKDQLPRYPATGIRGRILGMGAASRGIYKNDLGVPIELGSCLVDFTVEVVPLDDCIEKILSLQTLDLSFEQYFSPVCMKGVVTGGAERAIMSILPGSSVLTGFGQLAGIVVDSVSYSSIEHYFVMINFNKDLQYLLEIEEQGFLRDRLKVVRAPLYREKGGWERIFLQYSVPDAYEEEATQPQVPKVYDAPTSPKFIDEVHAQRSSSWRFQLNLQALFISALSSVRTF